VTYVENVNNALDIAAQQSPQTSRLVLVFAGARSNDITKACKASSWALARYPLAVLYLNTTYRILDELTKGEMEKWL